MSSVKTFSVTVPVTQEQREEADKVAVRLGRSLAAQRIYSRMVRAKDRELLHTLNHSYHNENVIEAVERWRNRVFDASEDAITEELLRIGNR